MKKNFARERYTSNKEGELNSILYLQIQTETENIVAGHIDVRKVKRFIIYAPG